MPSGGSAVQGREWVEDFLLDGPGAAPCLDLDRPLSRARLRSLVAEVGDRVRSAGVRAGSTVAVQIPPSQAYVSHLLALISAGAQVMVLDHRLTEVETAAALEQWRPQFVATGAAQPGALRGFHDSGARLVGLEQGRAARTDHAVVQLSSGSTGRPKRIGRTLDDITGEISRLRAVPSMPAEGERAVVLNSLQHSMGIFTGLFYDLHTRVEIVVPEWMTAEGILGAVSRSDRPTTVFGVPFHTRLLSMVSDPPRMPHVRSVATAGEVLTGDAVTSFRERFGFAPGNLYGMTEVGLIAVDPAGLHSPSAGPPVPGVEVAIDDGELLVACPTDPYLDEQSADRWADGWLRTRDAAVADPGSGALTILGRLDSQVSVGGLKVNLTEVEHTLRGVEGVREGIVVHDKGVEAYVELEARVRPQDVMARLASCLAPHKRPRALHEVGRLPRTTSGKLVRAPEELRAHRRPANP